MVVPPQARPFPIIGLLNQIGTQRVAFDISQHLIEMVVGFDRKRLVPALVKMPITDATLMLLPAGYMRDGESLHEPRQVVIRLGPKNKMPVIRHQAITADAHRATFERLFNDALKHMGQNRSVTEAEVQQFVSAVDKNSDGKIAKPELFEIFKRVISGK